MRKYTVSRDEASGLWYAHKAGFPNIPVIGTSERKRRDAQKHAAGMMAMTLREYLELREIRK